MDEMKYPCVLGSNEVCFGAEWAGLQKPSASGTVKAIIYEGVIMSETLIEAKSVAGADKSKSSLQRVICIPYEARFAKHKDMVYMKKKRQFRRMRKENWS